MDGGVQFITYSDKVDTIFLLQEQFINCQVESLPTKATNFYARVFSISRAMIYVDDWVLCILYMYWGVIEHNSLK